MNREVREYLSTHPSDVNAQAEAQLDTGQSKTLIKNDLELHAMLERIDRFRKQVCHMRKVEKNRSNYKASAGGFLAEVDRMNFEVREYLSMHPSEMEKGERELIEA